MKVVGLAVYPLKGGRGIPVGSAELERRGLSGDRRWVIADPNGRFVSQREMPALARLSVEPVGGAGGAAVRLSFAGETIEVAAAQPGAPRTEVTVWDATLPLAEAAEAGPWLSRLFGRELRLFHQPDDARRPVEDFAADEVSLADGFPLLIANLASLAALSNAAGLAVGMERFRPNLVIDGAAPWAEDGWARLRVGAVELDVVKPCARCTVTTVDQEAGQFAGEEPLATLRRIRMSGDRRVPGVLFGWNAIPRSFGTLTVGDPVEVLATRPAWPIRPERIAAMA